MMGLGKSGCFFPFLKACEILAGALLLIGVFVPFALVLLAPIIANIVMFHHFLVPAGLTPIIIIIIIIVTLEVYLAFFSPKYSPIVKQIFGAL